MNVKEITPFHLFQHQGKHYVINIEKMQAKSVDGMTASALDSLTLQPEVPTPHLTIPHLADPLLKEALVKLGLVLDDSQKNQKSQKTKQKKAAPISTLAIFLTQSCNLKCTYCYGEGGTYGTGGNMEDTTAYQAVNWLMEQSAKTKKLHIVFFGGEPLLNFSLMKTVVEYAKQKAEELSKRVNFHVTTNGTLLNDEVISFLKEHQFSVMVSIDGPREIHDRQRPFAGGQGSYHMIVPKISKILEELPGTRAHAVIADETDPQIVIESLKELGFAKITTAIMSASLFDQECGKIKSARKLEPLLNAMELEAEAWLTYAKHRDVQSLKELILHGFLFEGIVSLLHNRKKQHPCQAGLEFVGISSTGDVYPCQRFVGLEQYKLGSVYANELDRDLYHSSPRTYMKACANCFAKYYCAGGCKYLNAVSTGSLLKQSDDFCRVKRRELELSAYILCMLDHMDHAFLLEQKIFPVKPCPLDFTWDS